MRHLSFRRPWRSGVDGALPLAGVVLLVASSERPVLLPLAGFALGLGLLVRMAEVEISAAPRPGRTPIAPYGCWAVPQAFAVRDGTRYLLFSRDEDPVEGGWSQRYSVRELGRLRPGETRAFRGVFPSPTEWSGPVIGEVPVRMLRFEHRERTCYLVRGSLDRALRTMSPAA